MKPIAITTALLLFSGSSLVAVFSYEQTAKMTGGMMAGMVKVMGAFSKQLREPIRTTVLVKGNRMARVSSLSGHIIDLDRETMTEINFQKRTCSVVTFAQMAEALKQMEAKLQSAKQDQGVEFKVKASAKDTGQTKEFSGLTAREKVLTIEMEGTDQQSGQKGSMVMTSDLWLAPVAGYEEVKSFYQRMAQKLNWSPDAGMFAQGRSHIARAMADLNKEAAALDGVPVFQVVKMGMKGDPNQPATAGSSRPAEQPQARQQEQPPAEKPSIGGALGRLGGGRLGGLGGLGRRKKSEPQPEQPAQPPPPAAETAPAQQGPPPDLSGSLMEMTIELTLFGFHSHLWDEPPNRAIHRSPEDHGPTDGGQAQRPPSQAAPTAARGRREHGGVAGRGGARVFPAPCHSGQLGALEGFSQPGAVDLVAPATAPESTEPLDLGAISGTPGNPAA